MTRILNLEQDKAWEQVHQLFQQADSLLVITGAGISAESGISTFRGQGGYWKRFRAEELASPQGFRRDPLLVWRWYHERREIIRRHAPNPAHKALVEIEQLKPNFLLVTQNVDGYHFQAGSRKLIEIHGNIWRLRCTQENKVWEAPEELQVLPVYCSCGALARPDVLWFGESYHPTLLAQAKQAARRAQIILVVGTSGMVGLTAALLAQQQQGQILEVNVEPSQLTEQVDFLLQGPAGQILPKLLAGLKK